jgi:hypothetical protein
VIRFVAQVRALLSEQPDTPGRGRRTPDDAATTNLLGRARELANQMLAES